VAARAPMGVGDMIKRREAWLDRHAATLTAALTAP
jgi:hypothetical protein